MRAAIYARILLITLSLLSVATSASAECAWVLWTAPLSLDGRSYQRNQLTPVGFPTAQECFETRQAHLRENEAVPGYQRGWYTVCLPDTVDPREPKGK